MLPGGPSIDMIEELHVVPGSLGVSCGLIGSDKVKLLVGQSGDGSPRFVEVFVADGLTGECGVGVCLDEAQL